MGLLDHRRYHVGSTARYVEPLPPISLRQLFARLARYENQKSCGAMTYHCFHGTGTIDWRCCMCRKTVSGSRPLHFCVFCTSRDLVGEEGRQSVI